MRLKPGDAIRVIDGPYRGWEGEVLRVEVDLQRVTVLLSVFAKPTALELGQAQVLPI
jgi:transcriptional antiterminator NusG